MPGVQAVGEPSVSVVIPTFNRANLVADSLNSVLSQDVKPMELIVVDDGSTDDTEDVVARWAENHAKEFAVRYVRQQNQGGNVARNRGISEARGEVIAFLDSDDLWHPSKLSRQLAVLADQPEVGAVYCGVQHVEIDSGRVIEPSNRLYPTGELLCRMLEHDVTAPTSTYMVRRSVFDAVGPFDVSLKARQDWDMWIRVASVTRIGAVPEPLVDFREHTGPRTASDPQREIDGYRRILDKYRELRARCPWPTRQRARASYYRRMGRVHFHHGLSHSKALAYFLLSIGSWPFVFDSYAALAGFFLPSGVRGGLHRAWNRVFGKTSFAIRSH